MPKKPAKKELSPSIPEDAAQNTENTGEKTPLPSPPPPENPPNPPIVQICKVHISDACTQTEIFDGYKSSPACREAMKKYYHVHKNDPAYIEKYKARNKRAAELAKIKRQQEAKAKREALIIEQYKARTRVETLALEKLKIETTPPPPQQPVKKKTTLYFDFLGH